MTVTAQGVRDAAAAIAGSVVNTSCDPSRTLSATGAEVFLKFENLQFTASFKERGALNKLSSLDAARARRRRASPCSAGNHAQGVAYHAKRLGIPATILMPRYTPHVKVERTREHGAEVILEGETLRRGARPAALDRARARAHLRASLRRSSG